MKKLLSALFFAIGAIIICQPAALAQNDTMDDVKLFQSFFRDAPIASTPYGEGFLGYYDFENVSVINPGIQGGFPVSPEFEILTGINILSYNPEGDADGETGLDDIPVFGRYNFYAEDTKFSGGAYVTLPVGSEDIGEGQTDIGIFGAVRHPLSDQVVLTGNLGIDFLEDIDDDRETSLNLGTGIIYGVNEQTSIIGELVLNTERDQAALSGGVDYQLQETGRLRAGLLLGLDDRSPDLGLVAGYLLSL